MKLWGWRRPPSCGTAPTFSGPLGVPDLMKAGARTLTPAGASAFARDLTPEVPPRGADSAADGPIGRAAWSE
jgi:hypothetical protein